MALRLNNSFFRLSNGSFASIEPILPPPPIGQIFRVVNLGPGLDGLPYTKIDGSGDTLNLGTTGQIGYILALSGSLSDSPQAGAFSTLTVTNLLITSSVDETPTFTEEIITTTGAGTWTKPVGVTEVIVECWGGGGAGGGATNNPAVGGGGGGGQYSRRYINYSSPSIGIGYSVGTGGIGGTGVGGNGADTTWNTNTVIAKGGTAAEANADPLVGALGGVGDSIGYVGDVIYFGLSGGSGGTDRGGTALGGFGGAGAGSAESPLGTTGGKEFGGSGALSLIAPNSGDPGDVYGGGGGGAAADTNTDRSGGNGAQGLIRIIYR